MRRRWGAGAQPSRCRCRGRSDDRWRAGGQLCRTRARSVRSVRDAGAAQSEPSRHRGGRLRCRDPNESCPESSAHGRARWVSRSGRYAGDPAGGGRKGVRGGWLGFASDSRRGSASRWPDAPLHGRWRRGGFRHASPSRRSSLRPSGRANSRSIGLRWQSRVAGCREARSCRISPRA